MEVKNGYTDPVNWEETKAELRARLAQLKRGEKGDVARKMGVSSAVLSQLISGYRPITRERAEEIMVALGGTLDYQPQFPAKDGDT